MLDLCYSYATIVLVKQGLSSGKQASCGIIEESSPYIPWANNFILQIIARNWTLPQ
jgi:hypothetical protein